MRLFSLLALMPLLLGCDEQAKPDTRIIDPMVYMDCMDSPGMVPTQQAATARNRHYICTDAAARSASLFEGGKPYERRERRHGRKKR